eukprot:4670846-Pyramimonas_sp.AAC.1
MQTLPLGAFGGAPYAATISARGVPKLHEAAMRTVPLAPSVGLSLCGHDPREARAHMARGRRANSAAGA